MPASMTAYINDARTQMDLMASFVLVWLIATVASLSAFIQHGAWILVALGTYGLAWLAYRGCVASAGSYGRALMWAMDLFRFDLYEQLRLPLPKTLLMELEDGPRLMELLEGQWAQDPDLMPGLNPTYEHPSRAAAGGDGPAA